MADALKRPLRSDRPGPPSESAKPRGNAQGFVSIGRAGDPATRQEAMSLAAGALIVTGAL